MKYFLALLSLTSLLIACDKKKSQSPAELIIGEWKISGYDWEPLEEISDSARRMFEQAAIEQEAIFQANSHFVFDTTGHYQMDFTGDGGDVGTFEITPDNKMVNTSSRFGLKDTANIVYFVKDTFKFELLASSQRVVVTIARKKEKE
jgi:hypothetical protein